MDYYNTSTSEVLSNLNSDANLGLSDEESLVRIGKYGKNIITDVNKEGIFSRILDDLKDPLTSILLVSSVISVVTGWFFEGFSIIILLSIITAFHIFVKILTEKKLEAFNTYIDDSLSPVLRNEKLTYIPKTNITIGDIVYLNQGNKILADGRIITSSLLKVNEFLLTSHIDPVLKNDDTITAENISLFEQNNMVFNGSYVLEGRGKMIVTAIGNRTQLGKLSRKISDNHTTEPPFQKKLHFIEKKFFSIVSIVSMLIFAYEIFKIFNGSGYVGSGELLAQVKNALTNSVTLIVAAIPRTLSLISLLSLALNLKKMVHDQFVVKRLSSFEKLCSLNVICSNNLDMLTHNSIQTADIWSNGAFVQLNEIKSMEILENFCINSVAEDINFDEPHEFANNSSELALLSCAKLNKINYQDLRKIHPHPLVRHLYSQDRRIMTTVIKYHDGYRIYSKGFPEDIITMCNRINFENKIIPFTEEHKLEIQLRIKEFKLQAKKVIAFAYNDSNRVQIWHESKNIERNLIFSGFLTIEQPLCLEGNEAIKELNNAGIKLKIFSNENITTIKTLANYLGIIKPESIIKETQELSEMTDDEILKILDDLIIISDADSNIKKRIVGLLQDHKYVVGIAGNGINEYSPLKCEDFSFSMGILGTQISRDSSDVIILDDSYKSIPKSILWSRSIYDNYAKMIQYLGATSLVILLTLIFSKLIGIGFLYSSIQLLWISLVLGFFPPILLSIESPMNRTLLSRPLSKNTPFVTKSMYLNIFSNGLIIFVAIFLLMLLNSWDSTPSTLNLNSSIISLFPIGSNSSQSKTIIFSSVIFFLLWNTLNCRVLGNRSIFSNFTKNVPYVIIILTLCSIHIISSELFGSFFGTEHMEWSLWIKIFGYSFIIVILSELIKIPITIVKFIISKIFGNLKNY